MELDRKLNQWMRENTLQQHSNWSHHSKYTPAYELIGAEADAGASPTDFTLPVFHVDRYGAFGDGTTDDTLAIRDAQASLEEAGGGILQFGEGKTYLLSTVDTALVTIPALTADFQPGSESDQYHLLLQNVENVHWQGRGTTLKSTITSGGEMFILDGVQGFTCDGITIESVTAMDGVGEVTTAGMNGFGITSMTRDSFNIKFTNLVANDVYVPLYIFGDGASAFRVSGVVIDNYRHDGGVYTLACHNNGDNVVASGVRSIGTKREYFVYGVHNHDVQIHSSDGISGFSALIKAYDYDTSQIKLKLRTQKNISAANLIVQSQHNLAAQPVPARCFNLDLDVNNKGVSGTGVGVEFQYYQDSTLTASSSSNLFDGIRLSGVHEQPVTVSVTQEVAGTLNTDELVILAGSRNTPFVGTGFIDSKHAGYATYTPVLKIGGSTTGITYAVTTFAEYWRDGQWVEALYRIVLTSKGAQTGALTLDLPVASSATNLVNAVVRGIGNSNMADLTSPITGFVTTGGTTMTLQHQGATGVSNLDDTNLTDTSSFNVQVRYPI